MYALQRGLVLITSNWSALGARDQVGKERSDKAWASIEVNGKKRFVDLTWPNSALSSCRVVSVGA